MARSPDDPMPLQHRTLDQFRAIVGRGLITEASQLHTYECDGLTNFRVAAAGRAAAEIHGGSSGDRARLPPRKNSICRPGFGNRPERRGVAGRERHRHQPGAHESHSGSGSAECASGRRAGRHQCGRHAARGSARIISMRRILRRNRCARIGGNVAENSGGAHCLKYGFTTTHVLGLEVVLPDGSLVHLGGRRSMRPGYDLAGVFVGSEGTLGIATKVILRIVKRPECIQHAAGGLHGHRRSRRGRQRHHRRGNASGGDRDDGQPGHSGGRSGGARSLSRLRRPAAGGTRRAAGGGRGA